MSARDEAWLAKLAELPQPFVAWDLADAAGITVQGARKVLWRLWESGAVELTGELHDPGPGRAHLVWRLAEVPA